ncbi:helix-turn-helix domain-containing protein [Vibrio parahaemolyticus]|uniref:helix-turn-helix domain-containing protein n=1 Tax=Vibrio parahaemolyticus TaxID=670 RepID=UPI0004DF5700|nr:helix-turn-helix domain-containing protein [Vibrio parahaemolyticus]
MHICPACNGQRESVVFVNTGLNSEEHYSEIRKCDRCLGAGFVSQEVIDAIEHGKQLRKIRIAKGQTLRQVAKFEGVSVAHVSRRELGYILER